MTSFKTSDLEDDRPDRQWPLSREKMSSEKKQPNEITSSNTEVPRPGHEQQPSQSMEVVDPNAGVSKVEAFNKVLRQTKSGTLLLWILSVSIALTMFAYSIDQGTTSTYTVFAAGQLGSHAAIAAVTSASQIVRSIAQPFLGKLVDITSRPTTYVFVVVFYTVGFIVSASGNNVASFAVGVCFSTFGKAGLGFLGDVIVADLTNLQWRGFFSSLLSVPFIVTSFIDGFITNAFLPYRWRWGLGMFAILVPVLLLPAIVTLYTMESKAKRLNMVSAGASKMKRTGQYDGEQKTPWRKLAWQAVIDIDLLGLLLLGFAFGLMFLSLSLYQGAKGGFHNASMIAMVTVGAILLVIFVGFELYVAPKPCVTKNIWVNRAFVSAAGIDISIQLASGIHSTYLNSYIIVITDWGLYETTLYNNITTLILSFLGPIIGIIMAKTHRFKNVMTLGVVLKLVGFAMYLDGMRSTRNTGRLIAAQIISGFGATGVVGSRVGSQASVPHTDLASVIAQLALWSTLGSSVGAAIAGVIWQNTMPKNLRRACPPEVSSKTLLAVYTDLTKFRQQPYDSVLRQCGIDAYTRTNGILQIVGTAISVVSILFCFLMPNYYLGKQHNVATGAAPDGEVVDESALHGHRARSGGVWSKLVYLWNKEA